MGVGLVLIDIQKDYFIGGNMALDGMEKAADNAFKVLEFFRNNSDPVFHVQHLSLREGATFFIPGSPGCEIHSQLKPLESEVVIQKNYPSSFQNTDFATQLEEAGVDELVFCGAMSHMCIDTTVRAAFELGYKSTLIADACATCDLEFAGKRIPAEDVHGAFMAAIGMVFANVVNADVYLNG